MCVLHTQLTHTLICVHVAFSICSVHERGGVARSTRLCADSGNRVETAAVVAAAA